MLPRPMDETRSAEPVAEVSPPRRRRAGLLATLFFSLVGNAYIVAATLVCGLLGTLVGFVPPRGDWTYRVARVWSWGLLFFSGVRLDVRFEEPLPRRGGFVFMANHQSLFDIPVLIRSLPGQSRFLAKRSLFQIPIFGWSLYAGGFVPVDREDRNAAKKTFAAAVDRLASGRSIVIYPEETRSLDGRLRPFKRGGVLMALRTGFPIVPVGIDGTIDVQTKTSFLIRPARVRVRIGRPIPAAEAAGRKPGEMADEVKRRVEALLAEDAPPGAVPAPDPAARGAVSEPS